MEFAIKHKPIKKAFNHADLPNNKQSQKCDAFNYDTVGK